MMMTRKFYWYRRVSGILFLVILIGLPFLRIDGESAFRFDVPSLRLLFFGTSIWMQDFFIVLIAVIFLTFLVLFATTVLGRVWCGWLCPQTVLVDVTSFIDASRKQGRAAEMAAFLLVGAVSAIIAASLIAYFVSPYDLPSLIKSGGAPVTLVLGSWVALTIILFLDLVAVRRNFCATVCPYAKLQSVLFDDRTLVVAFDHQRAPECRECLACVKACPVGIDIRKGLNMACIHCAECVDACTERMAKRDLLSLIRYSFGMSGDRRSGVRINPLITGLVTSISLVFLIYLSLTRVPFDMNVRLNYTGGTQVRADGSLTNSYELSLRNTGSADLALDLGATSAEVPGTVRVSPDVITLKPGTDIVKMPVIVTLAREAVSGKHSVWITLTLRSSRLNKSISKQILFMAPGDTKQH
jgi:cytochrome c oxidase accessory protein FixG